MKSSSSAVALMAKSTLQTATFPGTDSDAAFLVLAVIGNGVMVITLIPVEGPAVVSSPGVGVTVLAMLYRPVFAGPAIFNASALFKNVLGKSLWRDYRILSSGSSGSRQRLGCKVCLTRSSVVGTESVKHVRSTGSHNVIRGGILHSAG